MQSAMVAASTAGRTSWTRRMWAPARMAATLAAVVAWIRSAVAGISPFRRSDSEGFWLRVWARKRLREAPTRMGRFNSIELVEAGEDGVVFVESLAEAQAGIEDDPVAGDARCGGGFEAFFKLRDDERENFAGSEGRKCGPILGAASGVHEDGSAAELGAGGRHAGIPEVSADVVDDLGSGFDGEAGGAGVEGVDGQDGFGVVLPDGFNDRECTGLLFVCCERVGVGAGGFAADVEDICAFSEHLSCLFKGAFWGVLGRVEEAAVGEGVGCDVQDAYDEGSPA